jgi:hypothetical protein
MKKIIILFLALIFIMSCSKKQNIKPTENKENNESIEKQITVFESNLSSNKIKPTFSTNLDSLSFFDKTLKIKTASTKNNLTIYINGNKIETKKLETINNVWSGKDSVNFANQISQIDYYNDLKLLLLELDFYPCTGIGCGVNYQLIYDLKTKKVYPFGRFRTGFDMSLYKIGNRNYYLSKTFNGRNEQLKDTIYFELYDITEMKTSKINAKKFARYTYEKEDYENVTNFQEYQIK